MLTFYLRHRANELGADKRGYVLVQALLDNEDFQQKNVTLGKIQDIVEECEKQRFSIKLVGDVWYVRCNQGHSESVKVESEALLTELTEAPPICVHGTRKLYLQKITEEGLSRMKRKHIHLVPKFEDKDKHKIKSGWREGSDAFIYVDTAAAMRDGIRFFQSENGVILTEGNANGFIPPKYFSEVKLYETTSLT